MITRSWAGPVKFEPRKILVIDDDRAFLDLLQTYFVSHQYDVTCVENAPRALEAMREKRFEVVILDYQLPLINGDELIAMLQRINPGVRVIVVTGLINDQVEDKFRGLGYFAYFEKGSMPFKALEEAVLRGFSE